MRTRCSRMGLMLPRSVAKAPSGLKPTLVKPTSSPAGVKHLCGWMCSAGRSLCPSPSQIHPETFTGANRTPSCGSGPRSPGPRCPEDQSPKGTAPLRSPAPQVLHQLHPVTLPPPHSGHVPLATTSEFDPPVTTIGTPPQDSLRRSKRSLEAWIIMPSGISPVDGPRRTTTCNCEFPQALEQCKYLV